MGAACNTASMVEELKHTGPPLMLMDTISSDSMFNSKDHKVTYLFDTREMRIYNINEQLQYR
jgi:hypothetical protein